MVPLSTSTRAVGTRLATLLSRRLFVNSIKTMRNVEIKAKVRDPEVLKAKAKLLSKSEEEIVIKQHDTFFKSTTGRLKLRQFEVWILICILNSLITSDSFVIDTIHTDVTSYYRSGVRLGFVQSCVRKTSVIRSRHHTFCKSTLRVSSCSDSENLKILMFVKIPMF